MPQIEGVYAAAVTARRLGMQDINLGVMWELIDFLSERKIDGIVLLGPAGEFVHFSDTERMRMMGLAPRRSRVPVLVDVSHSNLDGAVELGQAAAAAGAAGVLLMPPYFYRYNDEGIRTWFLRFAEQAELSIPVIAANTPAFSNPLTLEVARSLVASGAVQGIHDSGADDVYLSELVRMRREHSFALLAGHDRLCCRALPDVDGIISPTACAIPELLTALRNAVSAGRMDQASRLDQRLRELDEQADEAAFPVLIKEAIAMRGFKLGPPAAPLSDADEARLEEFRQWFKGWLPMVLQECSNA